ncbi:MAG: hypothetical protein MJ151_01470, partial [Lachnospiraceae bacterium]|nr:hypothetical protein [Lachnospiraceae bacterium]
SIESVGHNNNDVIEIDEDTKKDLNLTLFDKLDDGKVKNEKTIVRKAFGKKIMLNANMKFHIAIFPILALLVPLFAYFILGVKFFTEHYMLLVFYEVMI